MAVADGYVLPGEVPDDTFDGRPSWASTSILQRIGAPASHLPECLTLMWRVIRLWSHTLTLEAVQSAACRMHAIAFDLSS